MTITAPIAGLIDAAKAVAPICTATPAVPNAGYLLIKYHPGYLVLTGTDLSTSVVAEVCTKTTEEGECGFCVSPKFLLNALSRFKGEEVAITPSGNGAVFECLKTKFALATLPAEAFPSFPPIPTDRSTACMKCANLIKGIKTVFSAHSTGTKRYMLDSVMVEAKDGKCRFTATDAIRIAVCDVDCEGDIPRTAIPSKAAAALLAMLNDTHWEECLITCTENQLAVGVTDRRMALRPLDGAYPVIDPVLKVNHELTGSVNLAELSDAVTTAAIAATEKKTPDVAMVFDGNTCTLSAVSSTVGTASTVITGGWDAKPPREIHVDPKKFLETIAAVKGSYTDAVLGVSGEKTPLGFKTGDIVSLVAPLRIKE